MDESAKKQTLRMMPSVVYLVGTREREVGDPARDLNAFVGSWVTQTSFKPPMVVVCVKNDSRSNRMIREAGVFTLNPFATGQKPIAQKFFKELAVEAKDATEGTMNGVPYRVEPRTGCPVFPDLAGWLACEVEGELKGQKVEPDHTPFLARVVDAGFRGPDRPLAKEETGWSYGG